MENTNKTEKNGKSKKDETSTEIIFAIFGGFGFGLVSPLGAMIFASLVTFPFKIIGFPNTWLETVSWAGFLLGELFFLLLVVHHAKKKGWKIVNFLFPLTYSGALYYALTLPF